MRYIFYVLFSILITFCLYFLGVNILYKDKILPNTYISGLNVGGLTKEQALQKIKLLVPSNKNIILVSNEKDYVYNSNFFKFDYDLYSTVGEAFSLGRSSNNIENFKNKFKMLFQPTEIIFAYNFDNSLIDLEISRIVGEEKSAGKDATFVMKNGQITIDPEREGVYVDYSKLKSVLEEELSQTDDSYIKIPFYQREPEITSDDLLAIQEDVLSKFNRNFSLRFFHKTKVISRNDVFSLLKIRKNKDGLYYDFSEEGLSKIAQDTKLFVDNKPRAMVTKFEGDEVLEFSINKEGSVLDEVKFKKDLKQALLTKLPDLQVPTFSVGENLPKEAYGIRHLLGVGKSKFAGSINSRVFNINHSASKINGTLVAPGDEFSFLKTVGPINAYEGFQAAYIISGGRTVLGEGGGVCQTSTTLFRAALNSGLPITARYPHAYRVGYYEQDMPVGFDASVYYPSLDFRFKNDTEKHILVQTEFNPQTYELTFYIFGTKDGRTVTVSEPNLYGYIPAPAPQYIEDPSLKPGQIKQVDFAASGITSSFSRKVERNGEILIEEKFTSTYTPWRAIFAKGVEKKKD